MENPRESESKVNLELPVKIDYRVINQFLQSKVKGKILSKRQADGSTEDQARVLDLHLSRSEQEAFDLRLQIRLELLSFFLKGKEVELDIHISLVFDPIQQEILVNNYKVEGQNKGWFSNQIVETLLNNLLYSRIKNKMKVDLQNLLEKQIHKLNSDLADQIEIKTGIFLGGKIQNMEVLSIIPGMDYLLIALRIKANNQLEVKKIEV